MELTQVIPIAALAMVFGFTEVIKRLLGVTEDPPKWFLAVPLLLGLIVGVVNTIAFLPLEDAATLPKWILIWRAVYTGLGYAGASVLAFELKKKFI